MDRSADLSVNKTLMIPFSSVALSMTPLRGLTSSLGIFVILCCVGQVSAVAQAAYVPERQAVAPARQAVPPQYQALSQDVTRPYAQSSYGEYEYLPQKGLYKDVTLGDVAEDFNHAFRKAGATVANINNYSGWTSFGGVGDFSYGVRAGVSGFGLPGVGVGWGVPYSESPGYLKMQLGPLLLDNFYAGYGAIYTDINGPMPGREMLAPDDRWAQIVWLSFRATLILGDSIAVSLQPYLYWLPNQGKVGWGVPGPFTGLFVPQLGSVSLLQVAWAKEVGNWKFTVYDQFSPLLYAYNIWDVFLNANVTWGDLSPIERVGRYGVGYGAGDVTNYNPQSRFGLQDGSWDGLGGYYNIVGARAYGTHGYKTQSLFYLDRMDVWDRNFRSTYAGLTGGAYIRSGDQYFSTYAGYNFATAEPFDSFLHWAVVGVKKQLTPSFMTYAQAGYYWWTGTEGDQGWLGLVGIQQRLGARTSHGFEVGRRVYRPVASEPGIENFMEYRLMHQLTGRTSIMGFAGMSERHIQARQENDYVVKYAGTMLSTRITQRLGGFASAGWEKVEVESNVPLVIDRWTYRLGLMYTVTQDIQSHCFYQYEDLHGSINYSEHYLYLGVSKRF